MLNFEVNLEIQGARFPAGRRHSEVATDQNAQAAFETAVRNYVRAFVRQFYTVAGNPLAHKVGVEEAIDHITSARVTQQMNPTSFPALKSKLVLDLDVKTSRVIAMRAM